MVKDTDVIKTRKQNIKSQDTKVERASPLNHRKNIKCQNI